MTTATLAVIAILTVLISMSIETIIDSKGQLERHGQLTIISEDNRFYKQSSCPISLIDKTEQLVGVSKGCMMKLLVKSKNNLDLIKIVEYQLVKEVDEIDEFKYYSYKKI